MISEPFRWLFIAFFKDGSVIHQTPDDINADSNQFKPVIERMDQLAAFELNHVDGDKRVTVDLITGSFIVNGIPMAIHEQHFDPLSAKLKLVYFRERREEAIIGARVEEDMTISATKPMPIRSYVNRYFIGWETEVNGKHYQSTIAVG